ncbi:MAG TPA: hypothetical protein VFX79_01030 [Candidatus Saccharimonadales bacterium]|nr:hypothetical protein [Candidatus Saccharimonadales bacterium]
MGKTITQPRTPENRGFHIDVTSSYALDKMGFDDPELAREVIGSIKKGKKRVWGFQAVQIIPVEEEPKEQKTQTDLQMEEAERAGTIDGWPLNPDSYAPNGKVKGELEIRGMVPGGIPSVKVETVPEEIPPYLNIP